MTVTLTMDATNARVRIAASGLAAADVAHVERSTDQITWVTVRGGVAAPVDLVTEIRDTFNRTVSNGWGSADTGQAWTIQEGSAADFSVSGATGGVHSHAAIANKSTRMSIGSADQDITIFFRIPVAPTGGTAAVIVDLRGRFTDNNNYYYVRISTNAAGVMTFEIARNVGGAGSTLVAGASLTLNTTHFYGVRLQLAGPLIRAKFWDGATTVEPGAWQVSAYDNALLTGNDFVVFSVPLNVTNTLPFLYNFDTLTAGPLRVELDDYEFTPGMINYYRVRGVETGAITFVAAGAAATGNNASVTPALPAGLVAGDAMIILASIRNSGAGTVNVPADWTHIRQIDNVSILGRRYVSGDAAPLVTFSGGVANADTLAQMAAWRRADIAIAAGADALNQSAAQNIAYPGLTVIIDGCVIVLAGWKQDDWTSVATLAGAAEIGETASVAGDDAGQVWDHVIQTDAANVPTGSFAVTGGASAISRSTVLALPHAPFLNEQTANLTPTIDRVWLKSPARPFLNRKVTVVGFSEIARPGRGADFDVIGRSYPVAVTDVRGSRRFALELYTATAEDAKTMDFVLASGDVLFVHRPAGCAVPGGYVLVGDTSERRTRERGISRVFMLPCIEVVPPGPDVGGAEGTWASVLAAYATWADVLAAFPTWADLLVLVGQPSEVIVP